MTGHYVPSTSASAPRGPSPLATIDFSSKQQQDRRVLGLDDPSPSSSPSGWSAWVGPTGGVVPERLSEVVGSAPGALRLAVAEAALVVSHVEVQPRMGGASGQTPA